MAPAASTDLTLRDNDLTLRDMSAMVRAGALKGYVELMHRLGVDPKPLLRRHRLNATLLADEDALLPLAAALDLFEDSARSSGREDFGLRLARAQDITVLGPVALAMQHCPTVAAAMDYAQRYLFVQSAGIALRLRTPGVLGAATTDVHYDITAPGRHFPRQAFDHGIGVAHHVLALLAGSGYRLHAVSLPYQPRQPLVAHSRYFGAAIRTGRDCCALHVDRACMELPVPKANPALLRMAQDYLAAHFPGPQRTFAPRVRLALSNALGSVMADKAAVAAALSVHPRTLQRRLDAEGTSFNAMRDEVRSQQAMRYLTGTRLPLSQVAAMLGFSEQSALTRYCRQRFGAVPSALRAGASRRVDTGVATHAGDPSAATRRPSAHRRTADGG
jgi:AraC-like DNA-binding protein